MVPSASSGGEIAPKLGAEELVASAPALAEVAQIEARSPFRLPSLSLQPANLIEVAQTIEDAFGDGCVGAVSALPSAFASPLAGLIGAVVKGRPRFWTRVPRLPCLPTFGGPPRPVALIRWTMGEDGRLLALLQGAGFEGTVVEGMGAGHVPAHAAPLLGELAARMPVVLASRRIRGRCSSGPTATRDRRWISSPAALSLPGSSPASRPGCSSDLPCGQGQGRGLPARPSRRTTRTAASSRNNRKDPRHGRSARHRLPDRG